MLCYYPSATSVRRRLTGCQLEQEEIHEQGEGLIDQAQECSHYHGDNDDHGCEALGLFLCGPVDLTELGDGLGKEAEAPQGRPRGGHPGPSWKGKSSHPVFLLVITIDWALPGLSMELMSTTSWAIFRELQPSRVIPPVLAAGVCPFATFGAGKVYYYAYVFSFSHGSIQKCYRTGKEPYSLTLVKTPAPTVLPPSRIANRSSCSMATGVMSLMPMVILSPGMTISVPSGSAISPVTSVVRM